MTRLSPDMISDRELRSLAGNSVYNRGQKYLFEGRVTMVEVSDEAARFFVHGSEDYAVEITTVANQVATWCECPHASGGEFCKHMVAACLYLRQYWYEHGEENWKFTLTKAIAIDNIGLNEKSRSKYFLFFSLQNHFEYWSLEPYTLAASVLPEGIWNPETPDRIKVLNEYIEMNGWLSEHAKTLSRAVDPNRCVNAGPNEVALANLISRTERLSSNYYFYSYTRPLEDYLALLAAANCQVFSGEFHEPLKKPVKVLAEEGGMRVNMNRNGSGVILQTQISANGHTLSLVPNLVHVLTSDPLWVLADDTLLRVNEQVQPGIAEMFLKHPTIKVPREGETEFLETFLIPLADRVPLGGTEITWEDVNEHPKGRLYLDETDGELQVFLRFGYGDYEVTYDKNFPPQSTLHKQDGTWTLLRIQRDPAAEEDLYSRISSARYGLKRGRAPFDPNSFLLRSGVDPVDFLLKKVNTLLEDGFAIYGEEDLKSVRVNRNAPTLSLNISSGIDWFDLNAVIMFGDVDVSLRDVRRAMRKKNRFIKLADGTIGELPEAWIEKYKHLFGLGESNEDTIRLSRHHLSFIDQLISEADSSKVDRAFKKRITRLKNFASIESHPIPENFCGELRPYQKAGFDWLHFLREYEFGGCLADDMGLGKTVQVLVYLQSLKETTQAESPSLVVLPRSLLVNWQREAEKFTPDLSVSVHFGSGRDKDKPDFTGCDIVLTTYGTMRRDIQQLRDYEFNYVILDESQAIKNPVAQVSKAARLLRSKYRLVMTGTPVENSTYELWSQFTFLNPGLLGNLEYFKREFAKPIERDQDEKAAEFLRNLVYPFILRRTKSQVAPELPPRTERVVYADMEAAQSKLYARTKEYYRNTLLGLIETEGVSNARMKILEGLLRLRQICNHPLLVEDGFKGRSSKMDLLMENLLTLRAEGHKVLVFSQFVQMLKLIEKALQKEKIPYVYLDGSTNKRHERVDEFQENPEIPFFLISLKAGGVGLNLTAADYVIHVDPWWNPAVEMQATDRTHRIGQDKPVFVYKLIVRDSVEEKILQLQEKKKDLVDQLITTESSFFKSLTSEDVKVLFE